MVTTALNLNFTPGGVPLYLHVTQQDVGLREYVFTPYTSAGVLDLTAAAAVTLEATKPDNNAVVNNCTYDSTTHTITYVVQEQLCAVVGRVWSKIVIRDTNDNALGTAAIVWMVEPAGVQDGAVMSDSDISALQEFIDEFGTINAYKATLDACKAAFGGPTEAPTASAMTNHSKVYVYTGSEANYTFGHWYYWNGTAWTDGGIYETTVNYDPIPVTNNLNWIKCIPDASGGYNPGNGVYSSLIYNPAYMQIEDGCYAVILMYDYNGVYCGKINTQNGYDKLGGNWKNFTGFVDLKYWCQKFNLSAMRVSLVVTATGVTVTDPFEYAATHVTIYTDGFNNVENAAVPYDTANGGRAYFTDGACNLPCKEVTIDIKAKQAGTGDPSPTNVRAISGWTGANVYVHGKNVLRNYLRSYYPTGTFTHNGITYTFYLSGVVKVNGTASADTSISVDRYDYSGYKTLPPGRYTLSGCPSGGSTSTYYMDCYKGASENIRDTGNGYTFTQPEINSSTIWYVRIVIKSGTTLNNAYFNPMIRSADNTDSTYEEYSIATYPVSWSSTAGTVYGGTLDVTTGKLTSNMVSVDLGSLSWEYDSAIPLFYSQDIKNLCKKKDTNTVAANIVCDRYKTVSFNDLYVTYKANNTMALNTSGNFSVINTSYSTAAAFKTAMSGVMLYYETLTPTTYYLTPTEVYTLLGENNIWADTGDISVVYQADTKKYIQKLTGSTEEDMIANANIASGKYFMVGNTLYYSTSAITAGQTITPGTNCTLTSLAEALNTINS